jgi:hypothetical protein
MPALPTVSIFTPRFAGNKVSSEAGGEASVNVVRC